MTNPWHISSSPLAGHTLASVHGELDLSNAEQARADLHGLLTRAPRGGGVIIDLSGLGFCDSSGLNTLVALNALARSRHIELALCSATGRVARVLAITQLERFLPVHPDLESAVRSLEGIPSHSPSQQNSQPHTTRQVSRAGIRSHVQVHQPSCSE